MNKPVRSIIGLAIIIVVLIVGYSVISPGKIDYKLTAQQTLEEILLLEDEIFPEDVDYLLEDEEFTYYFIDIRTPYEYTNSHISSAVNIPIHFFLDRDNINLFDRLASDSAIVVLYGKDQNQANKGWMLLKQLGYDNIKVLLGGFDYYSTGILDLYDMPEIPEYLVEEAVFDFAGIMEEMSSGSFSTTEPSQQQEVIITQRKKKKTVVEGGC